MRKFGIVLPYAIVAVLTVVFGSGAYAQVTPAAFTCIAAKSGTTCPDGSTPLRAFSGTAPPAPYGYVSVAGFFEAGDGGAGDYFWLGSTAGSQGHPEKCVSYSGPGTFNAGKNTITGISPTTAGLVVGESISNGTGTTGIPPGAEIASIVSGSKITMTLPATAGGTSVPIQINGDNGGTLILDSVKNNQDCCQKTNYRGDPHEFGAVGDGVTNDTGALQNWLGAYGNVNPNSAFVSAPSTFGPWIATVPANYMVESPLNCPASMVIQGSPMLSTSGSTPAVRIFAARQSGQTGPTFTANATGNTVMALGTNCRIAGITIDGGGVFINGTTNGNGTDPTILDNLQSVTNIQVGDYVSAPDIPPGTTVQAVNPTGVGGCTAPCVRLSATASSSNSERVSFNGPDAVDIAGGHASIDSRSLIENGYYNVNCSSGSTGLQLLDSVFVQSGSDDLYMPSGCFNVRVNGNLISDANGRDIVFGGMDLTVADGNIEQACADGIDLSSAVYVSVTGNFFSDNGKCFNGGAAVRIRNTQTASICGNHIVGNGEYSPTPAQIHFGGTDDGIGFCGNTYAAQQTTNDATLRPSYQYDVDQGTVVTNSHLYESPSPAVLGVFSPNAAPILAPLQVPRVVPNDFSGFTLSNNSSVGQKIGLAAGEAVDSSGTTVIQSGGCSVNLNGLGAGGLDTGSVATTPTTYFYFAIAAFGGSAQSCIASMTQTPTFDQTGTTSSPYALNTHMSSVNGSTTLYNVLSVTGVQVNDEVVGGNIQSGTYVTGVGTFTLNSKGTFQCPLHCDWLTLSASDHAQMQLNMVITDSVAYSPNCSGAIANGAISSNSIDTIINLAPTGAPPGTVQLSTPAASVTTPDCITVSGGNTITLSSGATSTGQNLPVTVYTGVYRLVGALYTTDSSGDVVKFVQEGNTFYLSAAVTDINPGATPPLCTTIGSLPQNCQLSVPCGRLAPTCSTGGKFVGLSVEAFGRVMGGTSTAPIILTSADQPAQTANPTFYTAPGYTTNSTSAVTAFPFRTYTDLVGDVQVQGAGSGTSSTVYEVTDGWVFHPEAALTAFAQSNLLAQAKTSTRPVRRKHGGPAGG